MFNMNILEGTFSFLAFFTLSPLRSFGGRIFVPPPPPIFDKTPSSPVPLPQINEGRHDRRFEGVERAGSYTNLDADVGASYPRSMHRRQAIGNRSVGAIRA